MSIKNVEIFFDMASKDNVMANELKQVIQKYKDANLTDEKFNHVIDEKILPLASSRGLEFTAYDMKQYLEKRTFALSEDDLELVSGGVKLSNSIFSMFMTATLLLGSSSVSRAMFDETMLSSSPTSQMQTRTENSEEKNVEGYDLVRELKSGDDTFLHFKHKKTGAQVVVHESYHNRFYLHFGVPAENNKGTKHVLEHCLIPFDGEPSCKNLNGHTDGYGISVSLVSRSFDESGFNILNPGFSALMNSLCRPAFLSDKTIFDVESHMTYEIPDGTQLEGGRVFIEEQGEDNPRTVVFSDSKTSFASGGIPSEIRKLSYEEVCDAYNEYIHPSNSLTIIELEKDNFNQYKEILKRESEEYFSKFEKKDVEVNFDLECEVPDYVYNKCEVKDGEEKIVSANVKIDLRHLNDSQLDAYRMLRKTFGDRYNEFNQKVIEKGYSFCSFDFDFSGHRPHFYVSITGKSDADFTQEKLTQLANELISDAVSLMPETEPSNRENDFMFYKGSVFFVMLPESFAFHGDPFSEKCFTIENGRLQDLSFKNVSEYQNEILKNLSSKKITVSEMVEKNFNYNDSSYVNFNLGNYISGDSLTDEIVLTLISERILYPHIERKGISYAVPKFKINSENICYKEKADGLQVPYERYFFENEFNELVKNFKVTQDMIDQLKEGDEFSTEFKTRLDSLSLEQLQNYINSVECKGITTEQEND